MDKGFNKCLSWCKKYHTKIINHLSNYNFNNVIICGKLFELALKDMRIDIKKIRCMPNEKKIIDYLKINLRNNDIILIKCSNSTKVNNLAKILINKKD